MWNARRRPVQRFARLVPFVIIAAAGLAGFLHAGRAPAAAATAAGSSPPLPAPPPDTAAARQVYLRDCATCHGADANGTSVAPTLQGVGPAAVDFWVSTGRMPLVGNFRPPKSPQGQAPPGQLAGRSERADPRAAARRTRRR